MLRSRGRFTPLLLAALITGCAEAEEPAVEAAAAEETAEAMPAANAGADAQQLACQPSERMPLEGRASPYDSAMVAVGGQQAKICYGRPSLKGRTMIGGEAVPYGKLWRTGANEPTIIHLPVAAQIAGMRVEPGSYSLYTIPGPDQWMVIINRSTSQWGHESQYTDAVRAQEVGRATVDTERLDAPVEAFTIRGQGGNIVLEWQNSRVLIPIAAA